MAKRTPIQIGNEVFTTKKAVQERCREIIRGARDGEPLGAEVHSFLSALLAGHPQAEHKVKDGVDRFTVGPAPGFPSRCFWLVRTDGTATDFSFNECLTPTTPLREFKNACRSAVYADILRFKHGRFAAGPVFCPITGEELALDACHVDHAPPWPFDRIAEEFLESLGVGPEAVDTSGKYADGCVRDTFASEDVAEAFRLFHEARASLRLVSRRANLSLLRRDNPA